MSPSARHWFAVLSILLILIGLAVAATILFALDARNGQSFVIGIAWALALLIVLWGGSLLWRRGHKALVGLLGVLVFLAANLVITLMIVNPQQTVWETLKPRLLSIPRPTLALSGIQGRTLSRDAVQVTAYHVTLTPADDSLTAFHAKVNIRFQENGQEKIVGFSQPDIIPLVKSQQGWLLKEARVALPERTAAQFAWKEAGVSREAENVCCFRPITIILHDLPNGVFYEAYNAGDVKKSASSANTETIEWTVQDAWGDREFAEFSLVPPPYQRFPLIHRVAALSSVADWVFTLGGMLGSTILASLLIPVLKDLGQQKVKQSLTRKQPPKAGAVSEDRPEAALTPLAEHLAQRLSQQQLAALRDEIDKFLAPSIP